MGYPHHVQTPMGGSAIEPKFPPNDDYHIHNGYGLSTGMSQNNADFIHHQSNGLHQNTNNFNYAQGIGSHFYNHHGYHSQMHSTQSNGYSSGGYYGGYYGASAGPQIMDMPLQCPATEPTNTVLGLQELGTFTNILPSYLLLFLYSYCIHLFNTRFLLMTNCIYYHITKM